MGGGNPQLWQEIFKNRKYLSIPIHHSLKLLVITSKGLHTAEIELHLLYIPVVSLLPPPLHNSFTFFPSSSSPCFICTFIFLSNLFSSPQTHTHTHSLSVLPLSHSSLFSSQPDHSNPSINRKTTVNKNQRGGCCQCNQKNISLHFFSTPLAACALCLSFSQYTAAPPSTSLISCPSLFPLCLY